MSSSVSNIVSSLKTTLASALPAFSELSHVYDLTKNPFRVSPKKYGVVCSSVDELVGVTNHITYRQNFDIVLTDAYITEAISDSAKQSAINSLFENWATFYKKCIQTRVSANVHVININNASINEPEIDEDSKLIVLRGTINITYRDAI